MYPLIYSVNIVLLLLIVRYEYDSGNDKTIIISSLSFLILIVLNLLLGFFAQMGKKRISRHYYFSVLGLLISAFVLLSMLMME